METFLSLIRLALERGWTLGLLFIIFFGLAVLGPLYGYQFPKIATDWADAGFAFGIAAFVVSVVANLIRYGHSKLLARRETRDEHRHYIKEARANLELLIPQEWNTLLEILKSGRSRFNRRINDPAYALLVKGILVEDRPLGLGSTSVCDLHPGIVAIKKELLRKAR
jgi:hypothetical protein